MKEKKIIIVLLSVIIFLVILFFLIEHFGVIDVKIPTGNIDIFDINLVGNDCNNNYCNCTGSHDCLCKLNNNEKENVQDNSCVCLNQTTGKNDNYTGTQEEMQNNVVVYDEQVEYANSVPLNIFAHKSYYVKNDAIAPGTQNSYQFVIRNNNDFAIRYDLKMEEINPYNINMKYRLKVGGKYILGNEDSWVSAQELMVNGLVLADKSYNVYTLDWKWFESNNEIDTKIGTNIEANYGLNINFFANRY